MIFLILFNWGYSRNQSKWIISSFKNKSIPISSRLDLSISQYLINDAHKLLLKLYIFYCFTYNPHLCQKYESTLYCVHGYYLKFLLIDKKRNQVNQISILIKPYQQKKTINTNQIFSKLTTTLQMFFLSLFGFFHIKLHYRSS